MKRDRQVDGQVGWQPRPGFRCEFDCDVGCGAGWEGWEAYRGVFHPVRIISEEGGRFHVRFDAFSKDDPTYLVPAHGLHCSRSPEVDATRVWRVGEEIHYRSFGGNADGDAKEGVWVKGTVVAEVDEDTVIIEALNSDGCGGETKTEQVHKRHLRGTE